MKKASIFILIISFLLSFFLISYFGLKIKSDQLKIYISSVEINDCEVIGEGDYKLKIKDIVYDESADNVYYIQYSILPVQATETDGYEFKIVDGNGTFIDENSGKEYPYAEIYLNKVTFNCPCAITVMLSTTDGSGITDYLLIVCAPSEEEAI